MKFVGPPLEEGPLPALFYFALSAEESLELDPYNQPITALKDARLRCFSMTLPGHGPGFDNTKALAYWAKTMPFEAFFTEALQIIDNLFAQDVISQMAIAGLSRGAFVASHIAARDERIGTLVGFAPLTDLATSEPFADIDTDPLRLMHLVPNLAERNVRFYIGNRDTLVDTRRCFDFIYALAEAPRRPKAELIIGRSIGHKGHGTAPETFADGAAFIRRQLLD